MRLPLSVPRTWGGARKGAGRKPRGRPGMPHVTRPKIDPRYPVQVTIRATPGLPSLRSPRAFGALRRAIAQASVDRFRVIHFSIQQDHGHFIVEGDESRRARGGVHGLAIRLALAARSGWRRAGGPLRVEEHPAAAPRAHPT
jgi:putative transposase